MPAPRNRRRAMTLATLGAAVLTVFWWENIRSPPTGSAESFIAWARPRALALQSVEAGHGFADLQPLAAMIGNARVVGLGEATHGTREFFQFKHRMLEFLADECGFTALALETDFALSARVDAYVCGGEGDARAVVRGMGYWIWDTEEIVAMVEWMRQHNLKPTTARKLRFFGVDMQDPQPPVIALFEYLASVDAAEARPFADLAARATALRFKRKEHQPARVEVAATVRRAIECLEANRARFIGTTGADAWHLARQHAEVALQAVGWNEKGSLAHRDAAMAKNVQWILDRQGAGARVVLWAHNAHIMHRPGLLRDWLPGLDFVPMGRRLKMRLADEYFAVGLAFNRGEVRNMRNKNSILGPAGAETLDGVLARVGPPLFALDVRSSPDDPAAANWLRTRHPTRFFGLNEIADGFEELKIAECFDALVYFDRTTAARPVD